MGMIRMTAMLWPASLLLATALFCLSALQAWRGWLDLKKLELAAARVDSQMPEPSTAARIELADLRERLRKLEAIATGVDL
jgi:hypothetical protein